MLTAISAFTLIRCCCYSEIVLLCDFPSRSNKQPVVLFCFQKTPKFDKSCCIEEKNEPVCFSGRFEAGIIQLINVENTCFTIRAQFPASQKHVSWQLQSCLKIHLGHIVPFHEKRCQGRLFSENWFPYLLLLGETILSGDFPAWSWKESVAFIKLQNLTKAIALMRKMKQCVFLAVLRLKLSSFHSVKILLLPSGPNSQVHKIMFPCSFRTV